jgi:hypothetical protein
MALFKIKYILKLQFAENFFLTDIMPIITLDFLCNSWDGLKNNCLMKNEHS